jgi:hypothetical protein
MHISKMGLSCWAQIQPKCVDENILDRSDERQGSSTSVRYSLLHSSTEARADRLVAHGVCPLTPQSGALVLRGLLSGERSAVPRGSRDEEETRC